VDDTQTIETSDSGHLTPDEVLQLEIQAANERRRVLAEMEAAARAEGAALAQRALLLRQATKLAPERLTELGSIESLEELEQEVMALIKRG
jgi:hypothetical protein